MNVRKFEKFKFEKFEGFVWNVHKISRVTNSGLKFDNLANFIVLFPFLAAILYYRLLL